MTALLDDWILHLGDRGTREHTIRAYRRAVEHFIEWNNTTYGTDIFDPAEVIIRDIRDWISHQKTVEKSAVSTLSQRVTGLSRFFEWVNRVSVQTTDRGIWNFKALKTRLISRQNRYPTTEAGAI